MENFTIGKLAKQSGVNVETVRFYERKGLIKQPSKKSGFRKYPAEDVAKIKFIKRAQELGFTLNEVKELMKLRIRSGSTCGQVKKKTDAKIIEIQSKISDLNKMMAVLTKLSRACRGKDRSTSECPVLDSFESGSQN